ncbi:MAG: hypothetical protein K9G58_14425 [Bacteroidales bacterium]|nr:hypothetical protein [Bacteroidales bacterium]MCF8388623.1 hypothetical protein [Bacteroidales bacterium]MCF8399367.1 hypothetical protein [Bacteroidales bacterium]
MRTSKIAGILIFFFIVMISCQNEPTEEQRELITEKVQYDVFIKSPNSDYDWWIENLPGPQREDLVEWIFDAAESGDMQAYDYFDNELSPEDIKNIGVDTIYQTLRRTEAPFEEYDTMIVTNLETKNISKIRFLERWYFDDDRDAIEKEVIGIAPVLERKDAEGRFLANHPLFWLYFEER